MVEKHNIHTICAHKKIHKCDDTVLFTILQWLILSLSFFLCPLPPSCHFYSTNSLPFLFPLYLTRSVSHPEEIRNADGSWVVTVTVLDDLCPSPALYPSLLPLFPRRCLAFPAIAIPSSPGSCSTSFTFCMFCFYAPPTTISSRQIDTVMNGPNLAVHSSFCAGHLNRRWQIVS